MSDMSKKPYPEKASILWVDEAVTYLGLDRLALTQK